MKRKKRAAEKERERQPGRGRLSLAMGGLYGLSGFCVLAQETLWIHEISLWAGNTVVAATLVTVVFFIPAALGNWIGAEIVRRRQDTLFLYGAFEIAAAITAGLTFLAGQWIWMHLTAWPMEQISATVLLVGPPSLLSGLGFPILTEALVSNRELRTISAGPLYGMNLLGAALGVISGAVLLPWWLGIQISFGLVVAVQVGVGVMALLILPRRSSVAAKMEITAPDKTDECKTPSLGLILLTLSGLLSLAAQILLIQWARQILQGSIYALSGVLSAFICGLGLGSFLAAKLRARGFRAMGLLAAFAGWNAVMLFAIPTLGHWLIGLNVDLGSRDPLVMLGESLGWSLLVLLPLTISLGSIFPLAWELAASELTNQGTALGRMLAMNKTAAALGTGAAVFLLLPSLGLVFSIYLLAGSYLAIAIATMDRERVHWGLAVAAVLAAVGLGVESRSWPALGVSPKENLVADYSGVYGPVSVVENKNTGSRQILLNSRQHLSGTRRALSSQMHEGWVPLLFSPHPDRVLSIGMAAGITTSAMLDFPVKELDAVELVPEVVRAAREHFADWNRDVFSDPRVKITIGDGRVELARMSDKFDVIVCDLFFPCEDSTANLYSRDFFQHAKDHLQPDGLFCLWLPCYQLNPETAGIVIHTFAETFPYAVLVRSNLDPGQPVLGLLGSSQPISVSHSFLAGRLASLSGTPIQLQSPYFRSPENAQLLLAGDIRSCDPDFSPYPITSDDWPLFAFLGPREPRPGERLIGIPFLNWIGKRFLKPSFPSCDLGDTSAEDLLKTIRAANYYFAAAVFGSIVPGVTRTDDERESQVLHALRHAQSLNPMVQLPDDALGQ